MSEPVHIKVTMRELGAPDFNTCSAEVLDRWMSVQFDIPEEELREAREERRNRRVAELTENLDDELEEVLTGER